MAVVGRRHADPVGQSGRRRMFGAADAAALAEQIFGPADPHRRQIARLAGRLPANGAIRLERLQGFGAAPGMLATCGCSRLDFPDGSHGVLIAAGSIALIATLPARAAPARPARDAAGGRVARAGLAAERALRRASHRRTIGTRGRSAGAIGRSAGRVCVVRRLCRSRRRWRSARRPIPIWKACWKQIFRTSKPRRVKCLPPKSRLPWKRTRTIRHACHRNRRRRAVAERPVCRCASSGRWIPTAASRSAPTNSPA